MSEPTPAEALEWLREAKVVAVLGAHSQTHRPAFYVPEYLSSRGYRVLPVNPAKLGMTLWDAPVAASLTEVGPVDLVDVFRRSDALEGHVDEILAMDPLPKTVWFQLGIRNDAVAERLRAAGIRVVQDRCTLADLKRAR